MVSLKVAKQTTVALNYKAKPFVMPLERPPYQNVIMHNVCNPKLIQNFSSIVSVVFGWLRDRQSLIFYTGLDYSYHEYSLVSFLNI